jgi:hypothetical protein
MTPQFLRAEAARFREMAEVTEREASKQRLLAMADDYDAKARVAAETQPPVPERDPEPEPVAEAAAEVSEVAKKRPSDRRLRLNPR